MTSKDNPDLYKIMMEDNLISNQSMSLFNNISNVYKDNKWLIAMVLIIIDSVFTMIVAIYGLSEYSNDSTWIFYIQTILFSVIIAFIALYTIIMVMYAESIQTICCLCISKLPNDTSHRMICMMKAALCFNKLFLVAYSTENNKINTMQIMFLILFCFGFILLSIITFSFNFGTSWKKGLRKQQVVCGTGNNGSKLSYFSTVSKDEHEHEEPSMVSSIFPMKTTLMQRNLLWGELKRPYLFLCSYLFGYILVEIGLFTMMILAINFHEEMQNENVNDDKYYLLIGLGHICWLFVGLYLDNECALFLNGYKQRKTEQKLQNEWNGNVKQNKIYSTNIGCIYSVNGITTLCPLMFGICVVSVGYLTYCFIALDVNYVGWSVVFPILMGIRTLMLSFS
eukprot:445583_1